METIRTLVKLSVPAAIFFATMWFVNFQWNPYKWCEDHPDADKRDEYYLCEPFGFELKKGFLDRTPGDKFAGEEARMYAPKKKDVKKKTYNCQDADVLMTEDGYNYCMDKKE